MYVCGVKKQCSYYGFPETVTTCKEIGEECPWPYGDESDNEDDCDCDELEHKHEHEHGHGGKPEHNEGEHNEEKPHGGKHEHPKGSDEKPSYRPGDKKAATGKSS